MAPPTACPSSFAMPLRIARPSASRVRTGCSAERAHRRHGLSHRQRQQAPSAKRHRCAGLTVSGNNVGIGTPTPGAKLSVIGNNLQMETPTTETCSTRRDMRECIWRIRGQQYRQPVLRDGGAAKGELVCFGRAIDIKTASGTAGSETYVSRMAVDTAGNIGIGNTAPETSTASRQLLPRRSDIRLQQTVAASLNSGYRRPSISDTSTAATASVWLVTSARPGLGFIMDYNNAMATRD